MNDDLRSNSNIVKRLRNTSNVFYEMSWLVLFDNENLLDTAADRIEELEADLRKMALDYLAADRQATECIRRSCRQMSRIEELEAKLEKAVTALKFYRSAIDLRIDCEITYAMQEAHDNAFATLAELKGETK